MGEAMLRAFNKFVSRMAFYIEKGKSASFGASLIALGMCAGLTACADDPKYPTLGKISDLENILSPAERQKTVQDLQKQDQAHTNTSAGQTASK